jgi:hypothetical protein
MPLPPIFQKKGIFLFYWLLILPLAGYMAYDRYTDHYDEIAPVLENTNALGLKVTQRVNGWFLNEVQKNVETYRTNGNETLWRQALAARKQTDTCQNKIRAIQAKRNAIHRMELNQLANTLRQLADSLLTFSSQDSSATADLTALLYQPAAGMETPGMAGFFKNARDAQTKLYLDDQIWKTELALRLVLGDILGKMEKYDIRFDDYFPVLEVENCAEAGKPFSGKIYLRGYSKYAENVRYFIDGREYHATAGLVQYQERFPNPGVHTRRVKVQVLYPLTQEIRTYLKDFKITVQ